MSTSFGFRSPLRRFRDGVKAVFTSMIDPDEHVRGFASVGDQEKGVANARQEFCGHYLDLCATYWRLDGLECAREYGRRGVVERQSARPVAPAAALAERAAAFIRRNATRGISSSDVAAHLGVSRSLADLRFRQTMGESMLEMILRIRLEAVKRKLRDTAMPVGQVTASCGFSCAEHAKRLFKARFGCSMREWRRRTASQQALVV